MLYHIIAAALQYLSMDKLDDTLSAYIKPDPENAWMLSKEERHKQLYTLLVKLSYKSLSSSITIVTLTKTIKWPKIPVCRSHSVSGCFLHGVPQCHFWRQNSRWLVLPSAHFQRKWSQKLLHWSVNIAVPASICLSPQLSLWSWTVNTRRLPGKNIPGDLQREHLNRVAKECTVKPPNNGLFGGSNVVRCREVVHILEVIEATPPYSGLSGCGLSLTAHGHCERRR